MRGDELPLQVGREFGHFEAMLGEHAFHFVGVGLALRSLLDIDHAGVPGGKLRADEAFVPRPAREPGEAVIGSNVTRELCEKHGGAFNGAHMECPKGYQNRVEKDYRTSVGSSFLHTWNRSEGG